MYRNQIRYGITNHSQNGIISSRGQYIICNPHNQELFFAPNIKNHGKYIKKYNKGQACLYFGSSFLLYS